MHVIVLDDDTAVLRSLELVLTGLGHDVTTFDDPEAACRFIRGSSAVDVLILDYMMPNLTGLDVLERIGGHLSDCCQVVLFTAHSDCLSPSCLEEEGVDAVLPKPVDLNRICDLVGRVER